MPTKFPDFCSGVLEGVHLISRCVRFISCSLLSESEPGASGHHMDSVIVDQFDKCRTYCCALCGVFQPMKELCMTTVPYSRTLIMLSYSLKSNVITPGSARKFYEDIFRSRQRVCKRHFDETVSLYKFVFFYILEHQLLVLFFFFQFIGCIYQ